MITRLRSSGMVHSDIREMNILVNDNNKVMLIDYDWVGIQGQVVYPRDTWISFSDGLRASALACVFFLSTIWKWWRVCLLKTKVESY